MGRKPKHGMWNTAEWRTWSGMKNRCSNPNNKDFKNYGGRGINVCERWTEFEYFFADMGYRPKPTDKIERRDNNGPYCPENCYWGTPLEQTRNRRISRRLTYNGETLSIKEWAERLEINYTTIFHRFSHGWPVEKILTVAATKANGNLVRYGYI